MKHEIRDFDPAEYLDNEEALAEYLTDALATEDVAFIADAIGVVARAKGMTRIKLLHQAEKQASQLIGNHRTRVEILVERPEREETLDAQSIKACLDPDNKVTPFVENRKEV